MKRLTYRNLLRGIKIMQAKGYDWETSEMLARMKFEELEADRSGYWTFEKLAEFVVTKEEFDREYGPIIHCDGNGKPWKG